MTRSTFCLFTFGPHGNTLKYLNALTVFNLPLFQCSFLFRNESQQNRRQQLLSFLLSSCYFIVMLFMIFELYCFVPLIQRYITDSFTFNRGVWAAWEIKSQWGLIRRTVIEKLNTPLLMKALAKWNHKDKTFAMLWTLSQPLNVSTLGQLLRLRLAYRCVLLCMFLWMEKKNVYKTKYASFKELYIKC